MVISIWWGFFESSQLALHYLKLTMTRHTNPSVHEKLSFFFPGGFMLDSLQISFYTLFKLEFEPKTSQCLQSSAYLL